MLEKQTLMLCVFRPVRRTISQEDSLRIGILLLSGLDDDEELDGKLLPDDDVFGVRPSSTPLSNNFFKFITF